MWLEVVLGVLVCGLTILMGVIRRRRLRGKVEEGSFPPGPYAWPVVGNLFLLQGRQHQILRDVAARYGNIVGLRFGQQRAVVVSSPDLAKQVLLFHDKIFADRPPFEFVSRLTFGSDNGLVFARYGPHWRKNRKLCMLQIFTTKRLQELHHVRHQEMHALLVSFHRHSLSASTPLDFGKSMGGMSRRLILRLLYSRDTAHCGDEDLLQLIREAEQLACPIMGDLIPSLSFLDFFKKHRMRRLHDRIQDLHSEMLKERRQSTSSHDDLLHGLLSDEEGFTEQEMYGVLQDVLEAGIHTTSLTLEWAMAELLRHPQCFQRLRAELETQLDDEKKQVSDEDLHNLTYLKCVVKETLRLHPVGPLLVPRLSMEECKLQGYTIPAKTLVFVNVWAIGRDEEVWPSANEFMPERFEGKDIEPKGQHFELLPFGAGRRICLGLSLALPLIEVTIANLVKFFDWELPEGETHTSINMEEKRGLTLNKATPLMVTPKPRVSFLET